MALLSGCQNPEDTSSNAVCVKYKSIDDIDDIDDDCLGSSEKMVQCPGTKDDYECDIISGKLKVSGLENSAVKEFTYISSPGICTPDWDCTDWSNLANQCGTRTCSDSNTCGIITGKPSETKTCTTTPVDECNSNSDCDSDEECKNGECVEDDEPTLPENNDWIWYLVIGVLGILVLAVIGLIIHHFMNKPQSTGGSNLPPRPPRAPPRAPPRNYPPNK